MSVNVTKQIEELVEPFGFKVTEVRKIVVDLKAKVVEIDYMSEGFPENKAGSYRGHRTYSINFDYIVFG